MCTVRLRQADTSYFDVFCSSISHYAFLIPETADLDLHCFHKRVKSFENMSTVNTSVIGSNTVFETAIKPVSF